MVFFFRFNSLFRILLCGKNEAGFNHYFPTPQEVAATAKSLQSCPTLCDPIDGSPPGSPIPGILQARVLEWGAIAFSEMLI